MRYQELREYEDFNILDKFRSYDEIQAFVEDTIKVECSEFLANRGDGWLYRATDDVENQVALLSPNPNRRPLQTSRQLHKEVVKYMINLGAKAHRGNSFFCFGNAYDTTAFDGMYGSRTYSVLPKNGFHFSCQEYIDDFTMQFPYQKITKDKNGYEVYGPAIELFFKEHELIMDVGLKEMIQNDVEIMINGECWFFLESTFDIIKEYL